MPNATPVRFSKEICDKICTRLSNGESLRTICADEGYPVVGTFLRWVGENPELQEQYARAREEQAEYYADEIVQIADTCEDVNKARLQIDARKWTASKLKPKKYGEKIDHKHYGDKNNPIVISWDDEEDYDTL